MYHFKFSGEIFFTFRKIYEFENIKIEKIDDMRNLFYDYLISVATYEKKK